MCGENFLFFCRICACAAGRGSVGGPFTGSSHTTTPEKSLLLESVSDTFPPTVPAKAGRTRLKLISQREIIVIVQPPRGAYIVGSNLHRLESEDDVRRNAIQRIAGISEILSDPIRTQVAVAIVVLAAVEIKRQPRSGRIAKLRPAAERMNWNYTSCGNDGEALPQ